MALAWVNKTAAERIASTQDKITKSLKKGRLSLHRLHAYCEHWPARRAGSGAQDGGTGRDIARTDSINSAGSPAGTHEGHTLQAIGLQRGRPAARKPTDSGLIESFMALLRRIRERQQLHHNAGSA